MKSLQISIYEYEEVLYTLAWLSGCEIDASPQKVISNATQLGLVEVHNDKHWKANERNIFRRLENPKISFPHHNQIEDLANILIGFGEMSARSHGDFKGMVSKKFTTFFYKRSLSKIVKEILESKRFLHRKRTLEEIGYSQEIGKTNFDWKSYDGAISQLNYGLRLSTDDYGFAFIIKLCAKVIPSQYSEIVEKYKAKLFVGDLCYPVIEPLMFRDEQYIVPLLKSENAHLKLLACTSVVLQEPFGDQSTIDENIKMLVINGIDIGDAIWLSAVKLRDYYQSVEKIKGQIISTRHEILRCEKDPSNCPKGIRPEQWIDSKGGVLKGYEDSVVKAEDRLKNSFDAIKTHWPKSGITFQQMDNLIHLVKGEKLSSELVELIPSADNQAQILSHIFSSVEKWIGISAQPTLDDCEETFSYTTKRDLERLMNAAKALIRLSNIKGKIIGKFLGNTVLATVTSLEKFSCRPFMSVRKPSQWQSATSRLASIHLLAMCVFDEISVDEEVQVTPIVPKVIDQVNLLLKVQPSPFHFGADELFKDLKRVTAYIIASKDYTDVSAEKIALDSDLPCDYRARIIVSSRTLIQEHSSLAVELFENFSTPPLYVDSNYKHFSEWLCLLDFYIAHCWKFEADQVAQDMIRIWEQYCPLYGDKCSDYIEYAQKLYTALSQDSEEREWLKELDGFDQSNCMNLLKQSLIENDH